MRVVLLVMMVGAACLQTGIVLGADEGEYKFSLMWPNWAPIYPNGVAVTSSDNIYVADKTTQRILEFTSGGEFMNQWGSFGNGDGQFSYPTNVALDGSGNVYVSEFGNNRVQKFTSS